MKANTTRGRPPGAFLVAVVVQGDAVTAPRELEHEVIGVQMSEYIALGDWRLFFLARDDVVKMTAAQVAEASKKYFRRDNRTTGIFLPEDNPQRAEIPPTPTVAEVMKDFKPKAAASAAQPTRPESSRASP